MMPSRESKDSGVNEVRIISITVKDEDRVVRNALERLADDRRFKLTPGQETTIQLIAEGEEATIRQQEGRM